MAPSTEIYNAINRNRTHYLKWHLVTRNTPEHTSIRLYYVDDSKKQLAGWVMKNHITKKLVQLTSKEAKAYIKHFAPNKSPQEIISITVAKAYHRFIIEPNGQYTYIRNPR
jgi:hypothetical protein